MIGQSHSTRDRWTLSYGTVTLASTTTRRACTTRAISVLPLGEGNLDAIQVGGKRNYGYGMVDLKETRVVDLDTLAYDRLADAEAYCVELLTPFVLETAYPDANGSPDPWWWEADRDSLRLRTERLVDQRDGDDLTTVDHGQVVPYTGDCPIKTAVNGITRVGPHSCYGFGELRVHPLESESIDPVQAIARRYGLEA